VSIPGWRLGRIAAAEALLVRSLLLPNISMQQSPSLTVDATNLISINTIPSGTSSG
jgi:hypothetical protein